MHMIKEKKKSMLLARRSEDNTACKKSIYSGIKGKRSKQARTHEQLDFEMRLMPLVARDLF